MTTVDVAIATLGAAGIGRVAAMRLPRVEGVRYVVSLQNGGGCAVPPALAGRDDVLVTRIDCPGVSENRNHAFGHCTADVVLVADDDLVYTPGSLQAVRSVFDAHPELDYALFRAHFPFAKHYPAGECAIGRRLPSGLDVASFEIAFRGRVNRPPVRFDPRFGPGSPLGGGADDEVFALTLRRLGLRGRFFPVTVAAHPSLPASMRAGADPAMARAAGAFIGLGWPATALPRLLLKAARMSRGGLSPFLPALRALLQGWARSLTFRPPWKQR